MKKGLSAIIAVLILIIFVCSSVASERRINVNPGLEETALAMSQNIYNIATSIPDDYGILKNHILNTMFKYLSSSAMAQLTSDNNEVFLKHVSEAREALKEIDISLKLYMRINVKGNNEIASLLENIETTLRRYNSLLNAKDKIK